MLKLHLGLYAVLHVRKELTIPFGPLVVLVFRAYSVTRELLARSRSKP